VVTQSTSLPSATAPANAGVLLPAFSLWWREVIRFYRQKSRVVGVIASPLVFWLVIGSGFGTSFRSGEAPGQQHYLDYFYPGALIMIVLFTSIFTMMSVIEDRKEGFLLSVLVAPVPRSAVVLGKVMGGTTLSAIQGMIFLIFAPLVISASVICCWLSSRSFWSHSPSRRWDSLSPGPWTRRRLFTPSSTCS